MQRSVKPGNDKRKRHEKAGRWAETWAEILLRLKGYHIIERRYRTKIGEIDLIARKRSLVVFVEVKYRQSMADAEWALNGKSLDRIERAASLYISRKPELTHCDQRFDVIYCAPWQWPRHIKNISRY